MTSPLDTSGQQTEKTQLWLHVLFESIIIKFEFVTDDNTSYKKFESKKHRGGTNIEEKISEEKCKELCDGEIE